MTTERWDDARLDRLASTVETLSLRMNELAEREIQLASVVGTTSSRMNELAEREIQLASVVGTTSLRVNDLQESIEQTTHNLDILVGAVNTLIERDNERRLEIERSRQENLEREERLRQEIERSRQESEAYRRENDQRFNILLEEIRFLVRRLGNERGD